MGASILKKTVEESGAQDVVDGDGYIGSGLDCAVIPLPRHKNYSLVQTVDFFYPLIDDPRLMGRIALANVVSDIYAVGVTVIDKINMLITAPTELSQQERDTILPMIIDGFHEAAQTVGCPVTIQSMSLNPWCIIGGIASSVCSREEIVMPSNAKDGDVLVLTKPLGTHLGTSVYLWMQEKNDKYEKIATHFTDDDITKTFEIATKSMSFLNKTAALLMHKYNAHAATDITGFGLLGHAKNLAQYQEDIVFFEIHKLPIIANVTKFGEIVQQDTKLKTGRAVETSGGLLIALPPENAAAFCEDFEIVTKGEQRSWIIGQVKKSEIRDAILIVAPNILEVNL